MHLAMYEKGRILDRFRAFQNSAVAVAEDHRGSGDFRPVPAKRIDQEAITAHHTVIVGKREGEVIINAFIEPHAGGPAQ